VTAPAATKGIRLVWDRMAVDCTLSILLGKPCRRDLRSYLSAVSRPKTTL